MEFYKLTINRIHQETDHAVSISFNIPKHLKETFVFKAGQYITLQTTINDESIRRDYSLCTNANKGEVAVVIKEVVSGQFSKYANTILKEGDVLEVAAPRGRFTLDDDAKKRRVMAFAAGSGITPIMSIARTILESELDCQFGLLYGNKTPADTIFFEELNALNREFPNRFHLQYIFSESTEDNALFGRIDASKVNYVCNQFSDAEAYYICGPEAMIHTVSDTLKGKGISEDRIKFELFTVSPDATESILTDHQDGNSTVTVMVDDEASTFIMPQSKTILEAALENKIDAPYSCQGGICSSCMARLISGEAVMRQNNILTDAEVAEGLVLTCQAQPTTSSVTVDYDDV